MAPVVRLLVQVAGLTCPYRFAVNNCCMAQGPVWVKVSPMKMRMGNRARHACLEGINGTLGRKMGGEHSEQQQGFGFDRQKGPVSTLREVSLPSPATSTVSGVPRRVHRSTAEQELCYVVAGRLVRSTGQEEFGDFEHSSRFVRSSGKYYVTSSGDHLLIAHSRSSGTE